MKRFVSNLVYFFSGLILVILTIIITLSLKHEFKSSPKYNHDEFNSAFDEKYFDIIALGNSKLLCSLDKEILQNNTNLKVAVLGYSESNLSVSKLTLESYLRTCVKKPKIVLIEVSWFSFNSKRTTLNYITGDLQIRDPKLLKYFFRYDNSLSTHYFEVLKNHIFYNKIEPSFDELNFFDKNNLNRRRIPFDLKDFEKVFPTHIAGIDNILMEDFSEIVSMCKKNDIELILYTAPESEAYSLHQKDRNEVKEVFKNLSQSKASINYFDYTMGGLFYDIELELWLKDSHHVLEKELFTQLLVNDIKSHTKNFQ